MTRPVTRLVLAFAFALGFDFGALADGDAATVDVDSAIAIVPFAGTDTEPNGEALARNLAARIATISTAQVVPPSRTGIPAAAKGDAWAVRSWAQQLAVGAVVLGKVEPRGERSLITVEALSGHSGGPIAEYEISFAGADDVDAVTTELAKLLLADLGIPLAEPLPAVGAPAPEGDEPAGALFSLDAGEEPLSIDSDELELTEQGENRHLIFRRNVRVVQGDIELLTEKLEAFYESGSSQPEKLIATGKVRVLQGERRARCDRAVYQRVSQTVVCTGRAELVQRCDVVRGPQIHFDLGRDRVRVVGGASVVIQPDGDDGSSCKGEGA